MTINNKILTFSRTLEHNIFPSLRFFKVTMSSHTVCSRRVILVKRMLSELVCSKRRLNTDFFSLQAFNPSQDTVSLLSGDSEGTVIFLLIIMGVLLGMFALGIVIEVFLRKSGKRLCKPASRKQIVSSIYKVDNTIRYPEKPVFTLGRTN